MTYNLPLTTQHHSGSYIIYHLPFEILPVPRESFNEIDIPEGMQAMAQTHRMTHRPTDIVNYRLKRQGGWLRENN